MKRLVHSAVALLATFVAYQLYALAVVPLVEPALPVRSTSDITEEDWQGGRHAVRRYQQMLASYLPAGHWALDPNGKPQVYEYGPTVFVLDDYRPMEGGRVQLTKCVLVAFPTPRVPGEAPPPDAIVVEPPDGATIQFDEFDNSADLASSRIGKPVAGVFPGELVIRSGMREPGPQDDLRIVTRDLRFNQSMLSTNAEVDLRLGPHRGRGRVLEIRFAKDPGARGAASGSPIAGVESLEIREQVRASIDMAATQSPAKRRVTSRSVYGREGAVRLASAEKPAGDGRLDVGCAGSFRFDFTRFVASFEDDVRATLRHSDTPSDELRCRELRLHFDNGSNAATALNPADEPDFARQQGRVIAKLQPRLVEALGAPVRLDSRGRQAAVRGSHLRFWVRDERLQVKGAPRAPATIAYGLSEAEAGAIDYRSPPKASGRVVGSLTLHGAGWMRLTPSPDRPDRTYEARWKAQPDGKPTMTLARDQRDRPVLTIVGRPEFAAAGFGKLRADRVVAHLAETAADGPEGPAIEINREGAVLPKRVDAVGAVEFVGRQIEGRADSLVASLRPVDLAESRTASAKSWAGGESSGAASTSAGRSGHRYRLATRAIQLDVGLAAGKATPLSLLCTGGVRLEEAPRAAGDEPLRVLGDQLRVDRLNRRGGARLTIAGGSENPQTREGSREGLAEIRTRGLRVWVRDLHVDQAAGRAWTDGQGDAVLRLPPGESGLVALGGEATLRWRGGMEFDGTELAVSDQVLAEATGGWVNCSRLAARLTSPIDLRGARASGPIDVDQVECSGGVTIDYRSTDDAGQRSHERATMASLAISQRTGAISGQGPGSVRSVHLSGGQGPLGGAGSGEGLRFLRVDFRNALAGNLNERAIRFLGDVQTVYGPVLAWEHQLPLASPKGVPPEAMELRCAELRVHEDPTASVRRSSGSESALGPIEMRALRDVRIDASVGDEGGSVIAEAAAATYSQAADRFILEGDGRGPAKLWFRSDLEQPYTPSSAQRLVHVRTDNGSRTSVSNFGGIEYRPPQRAASPAARLR